MTEHAWGAALAARVDADWRPLRDAVEALGAGELRRTTPAGWTAAELLAHVAFWEEAVVPVVRGMFRGEIDIDRWRFGSGYQADGTWPAADVHNAREAGWAREQPPEAVLERLDRAHAALLALLETVTEAEAGEHGDYFGRLGDHYREHLPELEALTATPSG